MDKFHDKYRIASSRVPFWNYAKNGSYFVTICTKNRQHHFGEILNGKMKLSVIGHLANSCWHEIPKHFPFVELGAHIIMPDHMHGIVIINKPHVSEAVETPNLGVSSSNATTIINANRGRHGDDNNRNDDHVKIDGPNGNHVINDDRNDDRVKIDGPVGVDGGIGCGEVETPNLGVSSSNATTIINANRGRHGDDNDRNDDHVKIDGPNGNHVINDDRNDDRVKIDGPVGVDDGIGCGEVETPKLDFSVETPKLDFSVETPKLGVSTTAAASAKWNPGTLGVIINQYKRAVTICARKIDPDFEWQTRFHDHIIRDINAYDNITQYIINNPNNWNP